MKYIGESIFKRYIGESVLRGKNTKTIIKIKKEWRNISFPECILVVSRNITIRLTREHSDCDSIYNIEVFREGLILEKRWNSHNFKEAMKEFEKIFREDK